MHSGDQAGGLVGFVEAPVDAIGHDVGDAAAVGTHHGAAGRHGLQQHQAQGFGAGGKHEGVATGVGRSQGIAAQIAHEGGGRSLEHPLQLLAVGAIAYQGQAGFRQGLQHGADPLDLLFGREAADVEEQVARVAVTAMEPLPHGRAGQLGPEQFGVDSPLP